MSNKVTAEIELNEFEGLILNQSTNKTSEKSSSQNVFLTISKKKKTLLRALVVLIAAFLFVYIVSPKAVQNEVETTTLKEEDSTSLEDKSHSKEVMEQIREKYSNGNFNQEKEATTIDDKSTSHSDEIMAQIREKYIDGEIDSEIIKETPNKSDVTPSTPKQKSDGKNEKDKSKSEEKTAEKETKTPAITNDDLKVHEKTQAEKDDLIEKWGKWHFWDSQTDIRPKEDYCAKFPNRDVPENDFPRTAWQGDAVYVNHFLDSGLELIERAKEAIYTEYGHGKPLDVDGLVLRSQMFELHIVDFSKDKKAPAEAEKSGGWTTDQSFENIQRRLLHAVFTNDKFTIALGGDAVAAGHGNHFLQSYLMQLHKIMDPIFKRLNTELVTRNLAHEDYGALQSALGFQSIYGDDIDMIIWDGESENRPEVIDLFYRQALVSGKRAPILVGNNFEVLKNLHENAGADVLSFGTGMTGVPVTVDAKSAEKLPWAVRYLICDPKQKNLCDDPKQKFQSKCWIERKDIKPPTIQAATIENKLKNNIGFKSHMLKSRVMAFVILNLLENALSEWMTETIGSGHPLFDDFWHIGDLYSNISKKTEELTKGACSNMNKNLPNRLCGIPMQAKSEFTPRFDIEKTSLTAIIKPDSKGNIPKMEEKNIYDGPDVWNPVLEVPDGEIDVLAIVSNRRLGIMNPWMGYRIEDDQTLSIFSSQNGTVQGNFDNLRKRKLATITPGSGWKFQGSLPGSCDGTFKSQCGRLKSSSCLLSGHVDSKGGIQGTESNGWLVMKLDNVKYGIIIIKLVQEGSNKNDFEFEYAIDGVVKSSQQQAFRADTKVPEDERNLYVLLDDESISKSGKSKDMEVAIQLKKTGKSSFLLTHVYWG